MRRYILLVLVFIIALPLFAWQRWQPQIWLQKQIDQQQLDISISDAQTDGLSVHIAAIQTTIIPQTLRDVHIEPIWSLTMFTSPTIHLQALLDGYSQSLLLAQDGDLLHISDIDVTIPAALLKAANDSLPINLLGNVHLQGKVDWQPQKQRATGMQLEAKWLQASVEWMQQAFVLGDFIMQINNNDSWSWQISGGDLVHIAGTGKLQANAMPIADWSISGTIHLTANQDFPMLKTLFGANQMQFSVQGLLRQPQIMPMLP